MCQGNSFIDTYATQGGPNPHDIAYILYSSWEEEETKTLVYQFDLETEAFIDFEFQGYLEPSRMVEFKRNPYDGRIYVVGRPWQGRHPLILF